MTITVTVEELRAYDSALNKWYLERMAASTVKIDFGFASADLSQKFYVDRTKLDQYEKTNPRPTLIPRI